MMRTKYINIEYKRIKWTGLSVENIEYKRIKWTGLSVENQKTILI